MSQHVHHVDVPEQRDLLRVHQTAPVTLIHFVHGSVQLLMPVPQTHRLEAPRALLAVVHRLVRAGLLLLLLHLGFLVLLGEVGVDVPLEAAGEFEALATLGALVGVGRGLLYGGFLLLGGGFDTLGERVFLAVFLLLLTADVHDVVKDGVGEFHMAVDEVRQDGWLPWVTAAGALVAAGSELAR